MTTAISDEEQTLNLLLDSSLTPDGRSHLASTNTLSSLLPLLPSSPPHLLLPRLRLLRNLCAGDPTNQDTFIAANGPALVASAVLGPPLAPHKPLQVALQLLGNAALAGEAHRAAIWDNFFPDGFLTLARVAVPVICGTLCMVLDTCCSADGGLKRLSALCQERGLPIILGIISTASTVGYEQEWLEWLLAKICIEEQYLFFVFRRISMNVETTSFCREHAFLLGVLSKCLSERPGEIMLQSGFGLCIYDYLKRASGVVNFYARGDSALPTHNPDVDVLGYCLTILRDVCAWEGRTVAEDHVFPLLSAGLLETLLGFLRELEPPSLVRKSMMQARNQLNSLTMDEPSKVCPYKGFRKDVVSVICNCVHHRKLAQDEIRERNGIHIVLQQCVLDEDNPFLREWGLLTVSYLLDGNTENQREVADLQLLEPIDTAEIAELGLRVEIDREKQRAKLVNNS